MDYVGNAGYAGYWVWVRDEYGYGPLRGDTPGGPRTGDEAAWAPVERERHVASGYDAAAGRWDDGSACAGGAWDTPYSAPDAGAYSVGDASILDAEAAGVGDYPYGDDYS